MPKASRPKSKPVKPVPGIYDRGGYWQIRIRRMKNGKAYCVRHLPRYFYTEGDEASRVDAYEDARAYLLKERAKWLKSDPERTGKKSDAPTLRNWLDRFEREALDNPKDGQVRQGASREKNALKRIRSTYAEKLLDTDVRNLTKEDFETIKELMLGRSGKGAKPNSVKRLFFVFAAVWNHNNGKRGSVPRPWQEVSLGTQNDQRDRVVTSEEVKAIFEALKVEPQVVQDAIRFTLSMCCRRSETTRLRWASVNLGKTPQASSLTFLNTKTPKVGEPRKRELPIYRDAFAILSRLAKQEPDEDSRVFDVHPDTLTHAFRNAVVSAGIKVKPNLPAPRLHDLRHTRTTEFSHMFDVLSLATITGHKDMRSLQRYTHKRPEDLLERPPLRPRRPSVK